MPEMEAHRAPETRAVGVHATNPRRTTRVFRMRTARPMINPRTHLACDVHRPRVAHLGRLPAPAREASFSCCLPGVKRPSNAANRPRATLPPRVSHLNRARTPLTRVALGADPSVTPPGGSSASQMRSSRPTRAGQQQEEVAFRKQTDLDILLHSGPVRILFYFFEKHANSYIKCING